MKVLHVFTEEPSAKNIFDKLLPKILPEGVNFRVYPHQGKKDLENALKKSLPSISRIPGSKILITHDQDSSKCKDIKDHLNKIINGNCLCDYRIRIVCKELESWFLGDLEAVSKAYPRFKPEQYRAKSELKNVDEITNPNLFLLRIIPEYTGRVTLPKLETSDSIAPFLDPGSNKSISFKNTISAIKLLVEG